MTKAEESVVCTFALPTFLVNGLHVFDEIGSFLVAKGIQYDVPISNLAISLSGMKTSAPHAFSLS